jgi:hypothetical protein
MRPAIRRESRPAVATEKGDLYRAARMGDAARRDGATARDRRAAIAQAKGQLQTSTRTTSPATWPTSTETPAGAHLPRAPSGGAPCAPLPPINLMERT